MKLNFNLVLILAVLGSFLGTLGTRCIKYFFKNFFKFLCWNIVDLLEKEMATHSSTPAWEIPWTEELGGL